MCQFVALELYYTRAFLNAELSVAEVLGTPPNGLLQNDRRMTDDHHRKRRPAVCGFNTSIPLQGSSISVHVRYRCYAFAAPLNTSTRCDEGAVPSRGWGQNRNEGGMGWGRRDAI